MSPREIALRQAIVHMHIYKSSDAPIIKNMAHRELLELGITDEQMIRLINLDVHPDDLLGMNIRALI